MHRVLQVHRSLGWRMMFHVDNPVDRYELDLRSTVDRGVAFKLLLLAKSDPNAQWRNRRLNHQPLVFDPVSMKPGFGAGKAATTPEKGNTAEKGGKEKGNKGKKQKKDKKSSSGGKKRKASKEDSEPMLKWPEEDKSLLPSDGYLTFDYVTTTTPIERAESEGSEVKQGDEDAFEELLDRVRSMRDRVKSAAAISSRASLPGSTTSIPLTMGMSNFHQRLATELGDEEYEKLKAVRWHANYNCITCEQLEEVLVHFSHKKGKVAAMVAFFCRLLDRKENFGNLLATQPSDVIEELSRRIGWRAIFNRKRPNLRYRLNIEDPDDRESGNA